MIKEYDFDVLHDKILACATKDDVADLLQHMGIKGYRQLHSNCPLAVYFMQCGTNPSFGTTQGGLTVDGIYQTIDCTEAMTKFIVAFDMGDYSHLERYPYPAWITTDQC